MHVDPTFLPLILQGVQSVAASVGKGAASAAADVVWKKITTILGWSQEKKDAETLKVGGKSPPLAHVTSRSRPSLNLDGAL
jgi:hypothetical protein